MTERDNDPNFLRRWSRRKVADEATDEAPSDAGSPDARAAVAPDDSADPDGETAEVVADLPEIDSLHKDSDFTVFMREGVPEELKKRALRKLWLSDPALATIDGLDDYDDDYRALMKAGTAFMRGIKAADRRLPGAADPVEDAEAAKGSESTSADETDLPDRRADEETATAPADDGGEDAENAAISSDSTDPDTIERG